jgi:putative transcriptional regulator
VAGFTSTKLLYYSNEGTISINQTPRKEQTVETKTKKVAKRLKQYRLDAGLSQQEVADNAGIDRKTVNRIENFHFMPNIDTLLRLTTALAVKPADIFEGL